jgi:hypothetical protein
MSDSTQPPRFVPTLTEVVAMETQSVAPDRAPASDAQPQTQAPARSAREIEEALVQRVLQRVDLILERRLREAVGQVILEHTETLAPRLRDEIESMVRQSLNQAFAAEMDGPVSPVEKTVPGDGRRVDSSG